MSDREAFIRRICENPADDTVRLVYADWLDENGESARAEFIRRGIAKPTQVTALMVWRTTDNGKGSRHYWGTDGRGTRSLWKGLKVREIAAGLPGADTFEWGASPFGFRRGMVETLDLPPSCLAQEEYIRTLFTTLPITESRLTGLIEVASGGPRANRDLLTQLPAQLRGHIYVALAEVERTTPLILPAAERYVGEIRGRDCAVLRAAVSLGCLRYGRRLAGLPAWEPQLTEAA